MSSTIPHLEEIKEIRKIEQKVTKETGVSVCDVSHWNSGTEYKNLILSHYKTHTFLSQSDYHYSYEFQESIKQSTLSQLIGSIPNKFSCAFIHNATAAICCIADYLKKHNYKKICVLEPLYFSICSCLTSFGLNVHKEKVILNNNEIDFPYDTIIQKGYDAVWITSPVFSTGIYFEKTQINCMNKLSQQGILLILDESAASPNYVLTKVLHPTQNIIAIFSPHKYLTINSVKFAVIVAQQNIINYIEDWIDVFVGALPLSTCMAIEHYLSFNYRICLDVHDRYIKNNIDIIYELCTLFPDNFFNGTASNYITIRNKNIPYINSLNELNMYQIVRHTLVSFVPGYINGFSEDWGFCYRVNLTLDSSTIKKNLGKLFSYFS